jgi:hypothetical protein
MVNLKDLLILSMRIAREFKKQWKRMEWKLRVELLEWILVIRGGLIIAIIIMRDKWTIIIIDMIVGEGISTVLDLTDLIENIIVIQEETGVGVEVGHITIGDSITITEETHHLEVIPLETTSTFPTITIEATLLIISTDTKIKEEIDIIIYIHNYISYTNLLL